MSKINNSFGLFRTNPKLTSNYKLTVASDDSLSINSIPANPTLSSIKYVNNKLTERNTFGSAINRLYDGGQLKPSICFEIKKKADDETLQKDFQYQYEDTYLAGLTRTKSKIYPEEFSYFAPLYLRKDVPKYFVIFKVSGAANIEFSAPQITLQIGLTYRVVSADGTGVVQNGTGKYKNLEQFVAVQSEFSVVGDAQVFLDDASYIYDYIQNPDNFKKFINDSEIVKLYDIANNPIGSILNSVIKDRNFTPYPMEMDFDNAQISYHGIDIVTGVNTQITEDIQELLDTEMSITEFDEYVTQGFERNGLVSTNCVNIEFLFNDEETPDYQFARYFGLYVDDLPIGTYHPDIRMFQTGPTKSLYPFLENLPINYNQTFSDPNGIKIKPDRSTLQGILFEPELLNKESVFYIRGVDNEFLKIDNQKSQSFHDYTYVVKDTSLSIRALYGFNDFTQVVSSVLPTAGKSSNVLTVSSEFEYGNYIDFWIGKKLICRLIPDDLPLWNDNAYDGWITEAYEAGMALGPYFFPRGTNTQIATAIAQAFNNWMPKIYNIVATAVDGRVYFISKLTGTNNNSIRMVAPQTTFSEFFSGGTSTAKARVRISSDVTKTIDKYTYVRTLNGYSKVSAIAPYIEEPMLGPDGKIDDFAETDAYVVLTIDSGTEQIDVKHGQTVICELAPVEFGVFSFFEYKDFDFDFIKSDYNKYPSAEYKKYFDVKQLEIGNEYHVFTRPDSSVPASIMHDGATYPDGSTFIATTDSYTVTTGIAVIIDSQYLNDEELQQFVGFNTLNGQQGLTQKISSLVNTDLVQNKSYLFNNAVQNEYEYLREDVDPDLVLKSRTLPTILKWVSYGGTDIRGNKYRLNLSKAFGELGFSPSFFDHDPNPKFFTHEWPYLVGAPKNIELQDLLASNDYFTLPFDRAQLSVATRDYFTKYFTVDYAVFELGTSFEAFQIKRDVRYTQITKLMNGNLTTFFRGAQIDFQARQQGTDISRLADYKFSTILQIKRSTFLLREPQVDFEIVENKKFKNITFIITLICDDYKVAPGEDQTKETYPDYTSLYILQSLKKWNNSGYLYGLNYEFFNFFVFALYNAVAGIPVPPKVTAFRGLQLPSVINYANYGGAPNVLRFDDKYNISTFIRPIAVWDDVNKIPSIPGNLGRLIMMDNTKFTAITSEPIYFNAQQLIYNRPGTIQQIIPTTDLILETSGVAIINNPGQIANANYDPLDINSNIYNLANMVWFYENGGIGAYSQASKLLSFASIQEDVNVAEKYVRYTTIDVNGIESSGADFKLKMVKPSEITRNESIVLQSQKVVLPGLPQTSAEIFIKSLVPTAYTLNRFGGQFEPKTRDVLKFQDDYIEMKWAISPDTWANATYNWLKSQLSQIKVTWGLVEPKWVDTPQSWNSLIVDKETINQGTIPFSDILIGQNTRFDVDSEFAVVQNIGAHRVNQAGSTVFKSDTLTYPQVDEIAIMTRDINMMNSNWEAGFFTETIDKFDNESTYGTRNLTETKYPLGKALSVPDNINYAAFTSAPGTVDPKLSQNTQITDIVYDVVTNPRVLQFYIDLTPKFKATVFNGSKNEFYKYLTPFNISTTSVDDSVLQYIQSNIIPVFQIADIKIYTKSSRDKNVTLDLFVDGSNEVSLIQNGYVLNRNAGYKPVTDLQGIFTLQIPDLSQISVALIIRLGKI